MTPEERLHMVQRFFGWDALLQLEKLTLECAEFGNCDRKRIEEITSECRVKLQEDDQNMKEAKLYKSLELGIRAVNLVLLEIDADSLKKTLQQGFEQHLSFFQEQALHKRLETAASYQHQKKALLEERSSDRVEHLSASAEQKLLESTRSLQRLNKRLKLVKEERLKESQTLEDRKVALERELELSKMRLAAAQETKDSLKNQFA
ncbi:hypothetical protein V5799_021511, partial [Amblyomma americanum]